MTTSTRPFGPASLRIDPEAETARIAESLTAYLAQSKRRGVVVALSGGIDSSTVAALCVAAVGEGAGVRAAHARAGVLIGDGHAEPAAGRLAGHRLRARGDLADPGGDRAATSAVTTRSARCARSTGRATSQRSCCRA